MEFLLILLLFVVAHVIGWCIGRVKVKRQMPKGDQLNEVMHAVNEMLERRSTQREIRSYLGTFGIGNMVGEIIIDTASAFCFPNSKNAMLMETMVTEGVPEDEVLLFLSSQGFDKDTSLRLYEAFLESRMDPNIEPQ